MARWIREWFTLSALMVLGMGMLFMLWFIWPLLPTRLPAGTLASLNSEGLFAILMLFIIVVGFGKLMRGK
jgi:hypothetical protein